jgi:pilus assembly protein CpaE
MNSGSICNVTAILGAAVKSSEVTKQLKNEGRYLVSSIRLEDIAQSDLIEGTDIIVVEIDCMDEDELQIFAEVRARTTNTPLLLLSNELGHDAMQKLLKFNVGEWLLRPLDQKALREAMHSMVRDTRNSSNLVHAVISCAGGTGATTVAISMADIASRISSKKHPNIALVDMDYSSGNCSYVLNMVSDFKLGSAASAHRKIDSEFISLIQQRHEAGFYLYSFKRPDLNIEERGQELILRLLDAISIDHSMLILDIPYYATEWGADVLSGINSCTLVSDVSLPVIKHTLDRINEIKKIRGNDFPIHVVFNKQTTKLFGQRISQRRLKELLGDTPFSFLPQDQGTIGESVDRGILPSEILKRSPFLKKLTAYMKSNGLFETGGNDAN